ncbi:MAG: OsmC family protein [Candidatus Eisenbacteria bacterium]|uniref:OsmC family protein n=1 Tax=Eiseniibacteriota bacterium TaxID=2212470 RepID=A0A948S1C0_UNCEI|nr:OsmC family protein [Candidatus Eisenbacteria bacterium]MBU1947177.1 OsmC family protein [Candidatus Eisenbacteria bacterium]MBU2693374.1 OsmC family protein [Candidatus Eisenbacteria bacterium]
MSQNNIRNGVNLNDLMAAIEAVKTDPGNGKLRFTVNSKWAGGFKAKHTTSGFTVGKETGRRAKNHTLTTDEPNEVLGSDTGISPAETLMSSLAACLTVGYAANAAALGIDLDELSLEITGNGSLEGFMNLRNQRAGLSELKIKAFIKSDAPAEKLQELHDYVNNHSPIWDTICNPVKIESQVVTHQPDHAHR